MSARLAAVELARGGAERARRRTEVWVAAATADGVPSSRSASSSTPAAPFSASIAMTTSVGPASLVTPRAASASRFAAVPISTSHERTPSRARTACATCMSRTLSA